MVKNLPANEGDVGSNPGLGRPLGEGNGSPLPFLPGKSHGQSNLVGYSARGHDEVLIHVIAWVNLGNKLKRKNASHKQPHSCKNLPTYKFFQTVKVENPCTLKHEVILKILL